MWEVRVIELGLRGRLWEGAEEESGAEKAFQLYISHLVKRKRVELYRGAWISRKSRDHIYVRLIQSVGVEEQAC